MLLSDGVDVKGALPWSWPHGRLGEGGAQPSLFFWRLRGLGFGALRGCASRILRPAGRILALRPR
nr:MAG TPA: hypothetical protein [Caudoviricetes sp.]